MERSGTDGGEAGGPGTLRRVDDVGRPWLTPVGLVVIALVTAATAAGTVGLGTSGSERTATVAVSVYVASGLAFLLLRSAAPRVTFLLLVVMGSAAAALHHADPSGPVVGLFLVTAFAPLRLSTRPAAVVALVSVLLFDVVLVLDQERPAVAVAVVSVGAGFFFLFGLLLRREREHRLRVDALMAELEESRRAEQQSAALAERTRVAREIHDVLAHTLSGLVVQLDGARLMADHLDRTPELAAVIARCHELARDGLVEARRAVSALRGTAVPGPELLPDLVEEHRRLSGGVCRLTVEGAPRPLHAEGRLGVYRVAQESLSNVRKHAPGANVDVHLTWDVDEVVLEVSDDGGTGDPYPSQGLGAGLTGMRERAQLAGGTLDAGPIDGGFRVRLRMPLAGKEER